MSAIYGIGTDIVEVTRVRRGLERHGDRFRDRIFTPGEIDYCQSQAPEASFRSFAARFAAKEALAKALGLGIGPAFDWVDLEITRDSSGRPGVRLRGRALDLAEREPIGAFHLSLSHTTRYAVAYALVEQRIT